MHVIIVDTNLTTPPMGGPHTFLLKLCEGLMGKGWTVSIIAQWGSDYSIAEALRKGGTEVYTDIWRPVHLPEERAARLAGWVNRARPDVYVVSTSPEAGWLALPLLEAGIARLCIVHNDVSAYYAPLKHYGSFIDCAIGVSAETHRKIITECDITPEKARRIPHGVETISTHEMEERCVSRRDTEAPLRIGYIGRMVQEQKRVMDLSALAQELKQRGTPFEIDLIGDGSERTTLEQEIARQGLAAQVKFQGWIAPEDVKERCRELDVFILMSDYEGLPIALLEAMGQAMVPVVTRIASGHAEVVTDGQNGFLITVGDIKGFADRLEQLAGNPERLAALKRAAWETSRSYTVEQMVKRYVDCFDFTKTERLANASQRPGPHPYPVMPSCVSPYPFWLRKLKSQMLVRLAAARSVWASPRTNSERQ